MKNEANKVADRVQAVFGDANERAKTAFERNARFAEELTELTKGNVEAIVASTKVAAKGVESLGQDVAELSRRSFEEASATRAVSPTSSRRPLSLRLQTEYARGQFDSFVAESAKISEAMIKLAGDVAQPITNRYTVAAERVKNAVAISQVSDQSGTLTGARKGRSPLEARPFMSEASAERSALAIANHANLLPGRGRLPYLGCLWEAYLVIPPRASAGGDDEGTGLGVATRTRTRTKKPSPYKVLMLNDDYTPMEFVVQVLQSFFKMTIEDATQVMLQVHQRGVGVCGVFSYEVAETKVAQVIDYARQNQHPLQCTLEKA